MGVYIKGMEMPQSCYACMFFAQTDYWNKEDEADILSHCKRTGEKTWESVNGYLPNCPLVPVPPHGRLIEESKVLDIVSEWCPDDDGSVGKVGDLREMLDEIEALPAILPADNEEEEMK